MAFGNAPKLHGLIVGILGAVATVPLACGEDNPSGCETSHTCNPGKGGDTGAGGEAGDGTATGGSSGSASGGRSDAGGSSGSSGTDDGGEGGVATGGGAGTSGASGDAGLAGEGGNGGGPDTTPPTIVSVSPADGATGVLAGANLVVTFSEPMDRVSVQAAYQSADIPGAAVTFSWNTESTVLTINPNSDLEYAEGTDPSLEALALTVSVTDTAEDRAGNPLATTFDWSFRTLRRITEDLPFVSIWRIFTDSPPASVGCVGRVASFGDRADNLGVYELLSADISGLPDGIVAFEAATLAGDQITAVAATFQALGSILVNHVSVLPPENATWATPTLHPLGVFASSRTLGPREADALVAVTDDYQHRTERSNLSQYRLGFERSTNADEAADLVQYDCDAFALSTRYLVP